MRAARTSWRLGVSLTVGGALLMLASGAAAQTPPAQPPKAPADKPEIRDRRSPLAPGAESQTSRSVMGTVKKVVSDGLVVEEQKADGGKGKEWAFTIEPSTSAKNAKAGDPIKAGDLKVGDRVVVAYEDRSGKVVAQSITRLDTGQR